jgi:hypothetical protein
VTALKATHKRRRLTFSSCILILQVHLIHSALASKPHDMVDCFSWSFNNHDPKSMSLQRSEQNGLHSFSSHSIFLPHLGRFISTESESM